LTCARGELNLSQRRSLTSTNDVPSGQLDSTLSGLLRFSTRCTAAVFPAGTISTWRSKVHLSTTHAPGAADSAGWDRDSALILASGHPAAVMPWVRKRPGTDGPSPAPPTTETRPGGRGVPVHPSAERIMPPTMLPSNHLFDQVLRNSDTPRLCGEQFELNSSAARRRSWSRPTARRIRRSLRQPLAGPVFGGDYAVQVTGRQGPQTGVLAGHLPRGPRATSS
jgi:hypothetical protein